MKMPDLVGEHLAYCQHPPKPIWGRAKLRDDRAWRHKSSKKQSYHVLHLAFSTSFYLAPDADRRMMHATYSKKNKTMSHPSFHVRKLVPVFGSNSHRVKIVAMSVCIDHSGTRTGTRYASKSHLPQRSMQSSSNESKRRWYYKKLKAVYPAYEAVVIRKKSSLPIWFSTRLYGSLSNGDLRRIPFPGTPTHYQDLRRGKEKVIITILLCSKLLLIPYHIIWSRHFLHICALK
jgi:hypothetical protein